MKPKIFLFLLVLAFSACNPSAIIISHDFDHGSLGETQEIRPGYFQGTTAHWVKWDSIGDQYYWFYYRADRVKDQNLTFTLENMRGIYRGNPHLIFSDETQPVFSYDQATWQRIEDVSYDTAQHTFTFSQTFNQDSVWIAYAHPYPISRYEKFITSLAGKPFIELEKIASSTEERDIWLISITDPGIPEDNKKTIFLMALQHAGEDAGGFFAEGMVHYLLSDSPGAKEVREQFIFKVVPMMNPDGIFHGVTRYNAQGEDLNNIWINSNRKQPEVAGVKSWVEDWYAGGKTIDLFIDVHNHTQFHKYNVFIFEDHSLDSLVTHMQNHWPTRIWHSTFKGSSCGWFLKQGIPSGTIELTQSKLEDGPYLTIEDYQAYGSGTAKGIHDYFISE